MNAEPSWVAGVVWFAAVTGLLVAAVWFWDRTANKRIAPRIALTVITIIVVALASFKSIRTQYLREHAVEPLKANQFLQVELTTDSVQSNAVTAYHLTVTNISDSQIQSMMSAISIGPVHSVGPMVPVTSMLPARARVSIPGQDVASFSERGQLYVLLRYLVVSGQTLIPYVSSYYFEGEHVALGPRVMDPLRFYQFTGSVQNGIHRAMADDVYMSLADAFASQPVGTLSFWATEKQLDGSPNMIWLVTDRLCLSYNPELHSMLFYSRTSGKQISRRFEAEDRHFLGVTWRNGEPLDLYVDGKR